MIFYNLGNANNGRLGNQLFEYASCYGLSKKYSSEFVIPNWAYSKYFNITTKQLQNVHTDLNVHEPFFEYAGDYFETFKDHFYRQNVNIKGWLQSYKYWQHCEGEIKSELHFKPFIIDKVRKQFSEALSKPTIAISFRVAEDYIKNGNYFILQTTYQLTALLDNFRDWRNYNIIVFSDEIEYAKVHLGCLSNVYFASGSDIEQLALGSLCDHFIVSNSTFSWWQAYLGEKTHSIIIHPKYHFAGELAKSNTIRDYYPKRWSEFDHYDKIGELKRINLTDVTFTIPVSFDHKDRQENLDLCISYLKKHFDTNIIIGEQGGNHFDYHYPYCDYFEFKDKEFHRTKMLNTMGKLSQTQFIFNWDCDVFVAPFQILEAVNKLRTGELDMVYPYDGRFARVPRNYYKMMSMWLDVGFFKGTIFKGMRKEDFLSVGGAVAFSKQKFFEGGGENENFISYNPEDSERKERFCKLGYKVGNILGALYHLDHFISTNSSQQNPHYNYSEYTKVRNMSKEELQNYVSTWHWLK